MQVHGERLHPHVHRISDSMSLSTFQRTPLYADYYRRIGIDHVLALPLHQGNGWLVSWVLNRRGRDFSDREAALLAPLHQAIGDQAVQRFAQRRLAGGVTLAQRLDGQPATWLVQAGEHVGAQLVVQRRRQRGGAVGGGGQGMRAGHRGAHFVP